MYASAIVCMSLSSTITIASICTRGEYPSRNTANYSTYFQDILHRNPPTKLALVQARPSYTSTIFYVI